MNEIAYPLVGRDRELDALERLLRQACAGPSRFVVVRGEPGIGKTCLLAKLARRGGAAGCLVLQGRATELEREFPFGLLVDALDPYLGSLDARSFDRFAAEELDEHGWVFPALRSLRPSKSVSSTSAERFRALYAARQLLERLAAPRPLLMTFDDWRQSAGQARDLRSEAFTTRTNTVVGPRVQPNSGDLIDGVRARQQRGLELGKRASVVKRDTYCARKVETHVRIPPSGEPPRAARPVREPDLQVLARGVWAVEAYAKGLVRMVVGGNGLSSRFLTKAGFHSR